MQRVEPSTLQKRTAAHSTRTTRELFPPPFSTAPGGAINFTHTYDLTASGTLMPGVTKSELFPLQLRELDIHGGFAPVDITNGFLDGKTAYAKGAYVPLLPVASARIVAVVPEPSAFGLMLTGSGLLLGFAWLRRRREKDGERLAPRHSGASRNPF